MQLWFTEEHTKDVRFSLKIDKVLYSSKSKYQKIDIFATKTFGRILVLDGFIMTTEKDEFVYHESISHLPLVIHPQPKNVLIIGGGDGGTLRELAKHSYLDTITMVEIDPEVIDCSKKYLPFLHGGWEHPNTKILVMDGFKFLNKRKKEFDLIIIDSTDPVGPGKILFEEKFYSLVHKALKDDGIMVQQTESFWYHSKIIRDVKEKLTKNFASVFFFSAPIPSYPSGYWNFSFCRKNRHQNPMRSINEQRILELPRLKFLNFEIAKALFALPNFALDAIK